MVCPPWFVHPVRPPPCYCCPQNLHGMPGLLGGFIAGLAAFGQAAGVAPHGKAQLGFQVLSLLCTVAIASTGGALVCALATGG